MMRGLYILDADRNPVAAKSILEWGEFMHNDSQRRVALAKFGTAEISTVFLGMNYGHGRGTLRVFETAIFDDDDVMVIDRYATWAEAEAGHAAAVAAFKASKQ